MIEGALCFSAFVFVVCGILEFSFAIYGYNFCCYAAQDAARWASTRGANYPAPATASDVQAYVSKQAIGLANTLTVNTTWIPDNKPGGTVKVNVGYVIIPLTGLTLHKHLTVSSSAQMIISN